MRSAQKKGTPVQTHLMPAAEISVATCSKKQRMLETVHNGATTGVTTVLGKAAVLSC